MTVTRPFPNFSIRELSPGDIFYQKGTHRLLNPSLPDQTLLVLSPPRVENFATTQWVILWWVQVWDFATQKKQVLFRSQDDILDGKIYRDGQVIWDSDLPW